jgi:hypothetical protein
VWCGIKQDPEVDICCYIINIYFSLDISVKMLFEFLVSSVRAKNPPTLSSCSLIIVFDILYNVRIFIHQK